MASRFTAPLFDTGNGISPSDGAKLTFFITGTSTLKDTYSDEAATTPNTNPVVSDGDGLFPEIWITGTYKVTLTDKNNVPKWEEDPVIEALTSSAITSLPNLVSAPSLVIDSEQVTYLAPFTGSVASDVEGKLSESVSAFDFMNATEIADVQSGNGAEDVFTALQAAIASGYNITAPPGKYMTSATLEMTTSGQKFIGAGGNGDVSTTAISEIQGIHTSGPMIHYNKRSTTIQGLRLSASAARIAAVSSTGQGILGEAVDTAATAASRPFLQDLYIINQPADGIYVVGGSELGRIDLVSVEDCRRHGFLMDDGTTQGRTNLDLAPFIFNITRCRAIECSGNGLVMGLVGDTRQSRLISTEHFESLGCAWDAAVRISDHQVVDLALETYHVQLDIEDQQFDQSTTLQGNPRTARATPSEGFSAARNSTHLVNPFFSSLTKSVQVGAGISRATVDNPTVAAGNYGIAQPHAINIPANAVGVKVTASEAALTGATKLIENLSLSTTYEIDGDRYEGVNTSPTDWKIPLLPEDLSISAGTLDTTTSLVNLQGQGDVLDSLLQIRLQSGLSAVAGKRLTLIYNGTGSYDITILDVTTGGVNIRTTTGANVIMNDVTNSALTFVGNNNSEWVQV